MTPCKCGCGEIVLKRRYVQGHFAKTERWVVEDRGYCTPCWIWMGCRIRHGYGMRKHEGRAQLVHRINYVERFGAIPDNCDLDHLCRNPECCNPTHLEPVPHHINVQRGLVSILTAETAREIRETRGTYREKAERFGVSMANIYAVLSRTTWKNA